MKRRHGLPITHAALSRLRYFQHEQIPALRNALASCCEKPGPGYQPTLSGLIDRSLQDQHPNVKPESRQFAYNLAHLLEEAERDHCAKVTHYRDQLDWIASAELNLWGSLAGVDNVKDQFTDTLQMSREGFLSVVVIARDLPAFDPEGFTEKPRCPGFKAGEMFVVEAFSPTVPDFGGTNAGTVAVIRDYRFNNPKSGDTERNFFTWRLEPQDYQIAYTVAL